MTGGREAARQPARAPLRRRSRQRWMIAGGVAACWLVLEVVTGSAVSATVVLMVTAALAAAGVGGLRALGITRDHPWIRRIASRPWRDGQDVLKVVMRHLADVFVVTPSGALIAPNLVEVQLNPDDLDFLCERMEPGVISASMTEVYEEQVTEYGARLAGAGRAEVYVIAAGSVAPGRYRLRQGDPVSIDAQPDRYQNAAPEWAYSTPQHGYAESGRYAWGKPDPDLTVGGGMVTIMEPSPAPIPVLRLGHRLLGRGNPGAPRPRRARARGAGAPRRAYGVTGARDVHVLRRSLVGHEPGPERAHSQRRPGRGGATAQRRRYDPLGGSPRRAAVPRQDRLMPGMRQLSSQTWQDWTAAPGAGRRSGVAAQWRRVGFSCGQRRSASG